MKKKVISIAASAVLVFGLCACNAFADSTEYDFEGDVSGLSGGAVIGE